MEREFIMDCISPRRVKLIALVAALAGAALVFVVQRDNWLLWAVYGYTVFRIPLFSPDIRVYTTGIEVNRFGFKNFLHWTDIQSVHVGKLNSQIVPRGIPRWFGWFLYDLLLVNFWQTSYEEAVAIIQENATRAQQLQQGRVYR